MVDFTEEQVKTLLQDTLSKNAYWQVNKRLTKEIGLFSALIVADLLSKEQYFKKRNELDDRGFFFNTQSNISEDTTLTKHHQMEAIKELKKKNLIIIEKRGMPAKNYFKINHIELIKYYKEEIE